MPYTQITVGIDAGARPHTSDFAHPDLPGHRVITLGWDPLTIHFPSDDDAAVRDLAGELIDKLTRIRFSAMDRMDAEVPTDTPMGLEDDVASEAVA